MRKQRRALSYAIAALLLVLLTVIVSVALYFTVTHAFHPPREERGNLPAVTIEAAQPPTKFEWIISDTGEKTMNLTEPLRLYIRNIGSVPLRADVVYFKNPAGSAVLAVKLPSPITLKPGEAKVLELTLTYQQYEALQRTLKQYPYVVVALGSAAGASASTTIPSTWLAGGTLSLENVVFNVTMVIINCTDAGGWWVNVSQVIRAAENAAQKVKGLKIVIVKRTEDLYYLFHDYVLKGYTLNGSTVELNLTGRRAIIIDAHGEVLPLPPQYVEDIDNDGLYEIRWTQYALDIRKALQGNPWILVTMVGAPLYYLSNNGFSFNSTGLYFRFPDGTTVKMNATRDENPPSDLVVRYYVETDSDTKSLFIRRGSSDWLLELCVIFTGYMLAGSSSDGPGWQGKMQAGPEYRLAINGSSWHNFHPDWGGSYRLPGNSRALSQINEFFETSLPPSISAVRGVHVEDPWANNITEYLYGGSSPVTVDTVLVYDDFTRDSDVVITMDNPDNLDGGGRNMPYWSVVASNWTRATIHANSHVMELSGDLYNAIVRSVMGWADSNYNSADRTLEWMNQQRGVRRVEWSVRIRIVSTPPVLPFNTSIGNVWILLGNTTDGKWLAVRLVVRDNVTTAVSLVRVDNVGTATDDAELLLGDELSINSTTPLWVNVTVNLDSRTMAVSVGNQTWVITLDDVRTQLGLDNPLLLKPSLGFRTYLFVKLYIYAPVKVVARSWSVGGGYASAVFPLGEGRYIHGGYSPPYGIVKEFGYSLSDVTTEYIAEIAVYYPLYLLLKDVGVFG